LAQKNKSLASPMLANQIDTLDAHQNQKMKQEKIN